MLFSVVNKKKKLINTWTKNIEEQVNGFLKKCRQFLGEEKGWTKKKIAHMNSRKGIFIWNADQLFFAVIFVWSVQWGKNIFTVSQHEHNQPVERFTMLCYNIDKEKAVSCVVST